MQAQTHTYHVQIHYCSLISKLTTIFRQCFYKLPVLKCIKNLVKIMAAGVRHNYSL